MQHRELGFARHSAPFYALHLRERHQLFSAKSVSAFLETGYPMRAVNKTLDIVIFADYSMHVRKGQHATTTCQVQVGFLEGLRPACSDRRGILKMNQVRDLPIADETESLIRAVKPLSVKRREIRRSQRVRVGVDVEVFWGEANNLAGSEKTKTLVVSSHGALMPLRRNVEINELFRLRNTATREEIACRVIDLKRADPLGMSNVGIEFVEPAPRFWHIAFPPEDWSLQSPGAKGYRPGNNSHSGRGLPLRAVPQSSISGLGAEGKKP